MILLGQTFTDDTYGDSSEEIAHLISIDFAPGGEVWIQTVMGEAPVKFRIRYDYTTNLWIRLDQPGSWPSLILLDDD